MNTMSVSSSRPSAAAAAVSQPRLLCLHGYGSNSVVTATQLQNLEFNKCFKVTHLVAPWQCDGDVDESVTSICPGGPFYSWTNKKRTEQGYLSDLVVSMKFVLQHVIAEGPYDAVYGFSQGAGIAAFLSYKPIRDKLILNMGDIINDENSMVDVPWRFLFAACATSPVPLQDVAEYLRVDLAISVSIPSVHLIGIEDPLKGKSEKLFDTFNASGRTLSLPVYFDGGHEISSGINDLKEAAYIAIEWFSRFNSDWILPRMGSDQSPLCAITMEINDFITSHESERLSIAGTFGQYQLNTIGDVDQDLNLTALLEKRETESRIAFRAPGKKPITYGALREFVRDDGNLSNVGCKSGDKVAYLAPFGILGAVSFISITSQCTAIPLDPESSTVDLDHAFLQLQPDVFIIFDDLGVNVCTQAKASAVKFGIRIIQASGDTETGSFVFSNCKLHHPAKKEFFEKKGTDNCLLLRTSGTTSVLWYIQICH